MEKRHHANWKGGLPKCKTCNKELSSYKAVYCRMHVVRVYSEIDRQRMRAHQNKIWLGRKATPEHRKHLSDAHKGIKPTYSIPKGNIPWNKGKNGVMPPVWNKGTPCSEKTKLKISKSRTGKYGGEKHPLYGKGNPKIKGENNPNWKGGISTEHELIRKSDQYKKWRLEILKRDNYICQICKKRGGKLQVDHIAPFWAFPDLRFELDNGRTLCVSCHMQTDTWGARALNCLQKVN